MYGGAGAEVQVQFGSQVYCALGDHSSLKQKYHWRIIREHFHVELKVMMLMMPCVVSRVSLILMEPC